MYAFLVADRKHRNKQTKHPEEEEKSLLFIGGSAAKLAVSVAVEIFKPLTF